MQREDAKLGTRTVGRVKLEGGETWTGKDSEEIVGCFGCAPLPEMRDEERRRKKESNPRESKH